MLPAAAPRITTYCHGHRATARWSPDLRRYVCDHCATTLWRMSADAYVALARAEAEQELEQIRRLVA